MGCIFLDPARIEIGERALGGAVVVCPGVSIGGEAVGAGSVVVRDRPAGVLAVGNPRRIVRTLAPEDR